MAVIAPLLVLAACSPFSERIIEPEVSVADIRLAQGSLFEQRMDVVLRIRNPNDFDLPLDGLRFELEVNERTFVRGLSDEPVLVPRLGERIVHVAASTTLIEMVNQVILLGQRGTLDYRIIGDAIVATTGRPAVPFERRGTVGPLLPVGPERARPQPGIGA